MDIALRILHIIFGVFWAGAIFFVALVLLPMLRSSGPQMERSFWLSLLRSPVMIIIPLAALVTTGSGIAMALKQRWGYLDTFFTTGWGWAILISFVVTIAYLVVAFTVDDPNTKTMKKLLTDFEGREPNSDEAQQLARTNSRMMTVVWAEFVLMFVAVAAMAVARFV